jgi:glucose-6-phosphate 1-dehydrogenase
MTKYIKEIISALTFLSGIIIAVYGFGVKNANKDNHSAKIESNVNLLLKNDSLKTLQFKDFAEILNKHLDATKSEKNDFKALINSVNSLALKIAETPAEYARIMQGLTFEVVQDEPMKSVFPNPKIRITPIKK